jgi:nucleotide-binding universal stress UspA family protein
MSDQRTPQEIQAEIEAQRQQLASTVDDLAARLDVKSQAQQKVASLKDSATTEDGKPRPEVVAAAASLLAMALVLVWWRGRR